MYPSTTVKKWMKIIMMGQQEYQDCPRKIRIHGHPYHGTALLMI
jgi:hypothetical protein